MATEFRDGVKHDLLQLFRRAVSVLAQKIDQTLFAKLFVVLVYGFTQAIREQQQSIACAQLYLALRVIQIRKRAKHAAARVESFTFAVGMDQQRRIVTGVGKRKRALANVHYAVERRDE